MSGLFFGTIKTKEMGITPKKKICKDCGKETYLFSKGRCKQCAQIHRVQTKGTGIKKTAINPRRTFNAASTKAIAEMTFPELVALADRLSSWAVVNLYYKHQPCYTCGAKTKLENGHFIGRECMSLRYHLDNIKPQCTHCNQFLAGNLEEYESRLRRELGDNRVEEMKKIEKSYDRKLSRGELLTIIFDLQGTISKQYPKWNGKINTLSKLKV